MDTKSPDASAGAMGDEVVYGTEGATGGEEVYEPADETTQEPGDQQTQNPVKGDTAEATPYGIVQQFNNPRALKHGIVHPGNTTDNIAAKAPDSRTYEHHYDKADNTAQVLINIKERRAATTIQNAFRRYQEMKAAKPNQPEKPSIMRIIEQLREKGGKFETVERQHLINQKPKTLN